MAHPKTPPRPLVCPVCRQCEEAFDWQGKPSGRCIYGGPFQGYANVKDQGDLWTSAEKT